MDAQQTKSERIDFSELDLSIGTILTFETGTPAKKFQVRLIGSETGKSILVSPPMKEGVEAFLDIGSLLKVKMLHGTSVFAFETRVLHKAQKPYPYFHLSYPGDVESRRIRSAERIQTKINANIDSQVSVDNDWPKFATITDLSRTGARLRAQEKLGDFGHELMLEFQLALLDTKKTVCVAAIIRNVHAEPMAPGGISYVFGVQFLEMTEEARLYLSNYIYEQR
jgi:c-di-GMP-binding flagellar brake protein YcgR